MITIKNELSTDLFHTLYTSVGWKAPCKAQMEEALKNTTAIFVIYDNDTPIAMARLLGDGGMSYYVKDFLVIPSQQRQGTGRLLMQHIESYIDQHLHDGWAVSLELISAKDKEQFYKQMGFDARPSDLEGGGMFKMVEKNTQ